MEVLDGKRFVTWAEGFLRSQDVEAPKVPEAFQEVVADYIRDGYRWFAFNVVSLGPATRTKQAVQYRFRSDCVYFPLRITRTEAGNTTVKLLIVTRKPYDTDAYMGIDEGRSNSLTTP